MTDDIECSVGFTLKTNLETPLPRVLLKPIKMKNNKMSKNWLIKANRVILT